MSSGPNLKVRALGHLARREHSRLELEKKLIPYTSTAEELSSVLDSLEQCGLLSAGRMVEQLVQARRKKFGSYRIVQELKQKGINDELISKILPYLKETELKTAREVWGKKFGTVPANVKERAKQIRFLTGRGFNSEIITKILDLGNE